MTPKLSIIVPIYKVEKYLRKCVDSLLAQDMSSSEYEIILVDDGSPDGCPVICDQYAAEHENIGVIHRENGGLSAARNSGIEIANGEYIMFVDSDDFVEPNVLSRLIDQVERDNLDVLRYKHQYVDVDGNPYCPYKTDPYKEHNYSSEVTDGVTFLNTRFGTSCYAWAFILKRELLDGCLFTPGIYFEDTDWTPRMLVKAKRVASTDIVVYNYLLTRQGSITNAVNRSKQKKVLDDKMRLISEMQRQANELEQKGLSNAWFSRMISDIVISIVGLLSVDFYYERKTYLEYLYQLGVFPIQDTCFKAKFINRSPMLSMWMMHKKQCKHSDKIREFIRFSIVGAFATGIHYVLYYLLNLVLNVNIAYTIGYVVAWLCNFYLTAHFTFKKQTSVKRGVGFALSHGINYVLHMGLLNLFIWIGLSETLAPVPVFCIVIPINFILVRYIFKSEYFKQ